MKLTIVAVVLAACAAGTVSSAAAQDTGTGVFVQSTKRDWEQIRDYVTKAAEQVPDADYAFQPTPKVRTFGQLIAHLADDHQGLCAMAIGDKATKFGDNEKTKKTKAEIVAVLKASNAYCDGVFAKITEKTAFELLEGRKQPTPRLSVLVMNTQHDWEHYGNIVTYMRMKDLVPPSSQGSGMD